MTTRLLGGVLLVVVAMSVASGEPIVFNRSLTNTPGNIIALSPPDYTQFIFGDDFSLNNSAMITSLTVWIAAGNPATTNPNQELSGINLYLGPDPGPLSQVSSSYSFSSAGTFANPNTQTNQPLFAIVFSGLNFSANAGVLYDFAIEGIPLDPLVQLALTATPCTSLFGPCPGDGADGVYLGFSGTPGSGPYNLLLTAPAAGATAGIADINVSLGQLVEANAAPGPAQSEAVPEPSTFALLGLGCGVFAYFRRSRA